MEPNKKNTFLVRRKMGEALVKNGVITQEQLEKASKIHQSEPVAVRRRLSNIIVEDIGADRHQVMKSIARLYAFREVLPEENPSNQVLKSIEKLMNELSEDVLDDMVQRKTVPLKADKEKIVLACADPTDPQISILASDLPYKMYELTYCRLETVEKIINTVYEQKNEFLKMLDDIDLEQPEMDVEDDLDEEELDKEINQSMLNSLVEGMLVEAVRMGASDIHIIPGKKI